MGQDTQIESDRIEIDTPLVALFRHNLWANLRLFDACAKLDPQQLAVTTPGTYGSIYMTLRHIVRAEQSYLARLTRQPPSGAWDGDPDFATLRADARRSGERLIEVAAHTTADEVLLLEWDGKRWTVPSSLILTQAINHATEHRAQIMTILTQQGIEPPDLSGWSYITEAITPEPGASSSD